jgi:hypothetical protein
MEEMRNDRIDSVTVYETLELGNVIGCDFERRSWRYRVWTPGIVVVVTFPSETRLVVVTAWRE